MITYNGDKYSCVSCIRGHRAPACRHTNRMLVKVRTRGRPAADIRDVIMVDINSQVNNHDNKIKSCRIDKADANMCCKKMDAQPIIFVKAKKQQKAMLVDGKLQIITQAENSDDPTSIKYISEHEFLRNERLAESKESSLASNEVNSMSSTTTLFNSTDMEHESQLPQLDADLFNTKENEGPAIKKAKCCDPRHTVQIPNLVKTDSLFELKSTDSDPPEKRADDIFDPKNFNFDIFTHKGIYLSADCTCDDDNCQCSNCLIHRNEEELTSYIQSSGVPLTKVKGKKKATNIEECSGIDCNCSAISCACINCSVHPTEIIPFEKFFFKGLLNMQLKKKTIIKFKGKLIPSEYWWEFLCIRIPQMSEQALERVDLKDWFDKILETYHTSLLDSTSDNFLFDDLEGFYVI